MAVSLVSPELALVDPILRADALAALPRVEPFAFLERRDLAPLARPAAQPQRQPPLLVAATAYLISSLARVALMDALFVLGLAAAVAGLQLAR